MIRKDDPYNLESLHSDEHLCLYINTLNAMKDPLFKRHDKRIDNTNLVDFLHGHCLRFQDFTYSVLKADKSIHTPLCLECSVKPDSVHHKLFECDNFQSDSRNNLNALVGNLETNFYLPIIFHTKINESSDEMIPFEDSGDTFPTCNICEARKELIKQVSLVCNQSSFGDDMLEKNCYRNAKAGLKE